MHEEDLQEFDSYARFVHRIEMISGAKIKLCSQSFLKTLPKSASK